MKKQIEISLRRNLVLIGFAASVALGLIFTHDEVYRPLVRDVFLCSVAILLINILFEMPRNEKYFRWIFISGGIIFSLFLRLALIPHQSIDYTNFSEQWYDVMAREGGFASLKNNFYYSPPYMYMMAFLTYLPISKLAGIKFLSIPFDYLGAYFVYRMVRLKYENEKISLAAALLFLILPTVVMNGSFWAQCDSIYTSFLLGSLYFMMRKKYIFSLVFFGIAFGFKLQSIFFLLPVLMLFIKKEIDLEKLLIIPLVFVLLILPNYFLGRPFLELLFVYFPQTKDFPFLSNEAPSIYKLIPGAPFDLFQQAGMLVTGSFILFFALFAFWSKRISTDKEFLLRSAMISVLVIPFLLPQMHERYFFAADAISLVFAFYFPGYFYFPLVVGMASLFSYYKFLFGVEMFEMKYLSMAMGVVIVMALKDFCGGFDKNSATGALLSHRG